MNNQEIGKLGEQHAVDFLISQKYKIIERNYHTRHGELDIIAYTEKQIVFVEVKTRTSQKFGDLTETISKKKAKNIIASSQTYLSSLKKRNSFSWRIDLIGVKLSKNKELKDLIHIKNII